MTVPRLACSVLPVRSDAADAPLIVLGPSLGTTSAIWDTVASGLAADYRVLRYDLPGHGVSPAAEEPFTVAEIGAGVVELVDAVGGGPFFYAGDSLGSAVGLTLASGRPERVLGLVAFCAGATFGTPAGWISRADQVRTNGTSSVVEMSAARWFAPGFIDREPVAAAATLDLLREVDDESYALCCDALAVFDFRVEAQLIRIPVLCVAGEFDIASPPGDVEVLSTLVRGGRYTVLAGAGHMPVLELPGPSEELIRSYLPQVSAGNTEKESS